MIVAFLYRVRGVTGRCYGKYIGRVPAYEEGLDRAIAVDILLPFFQTMYAPRTIEEGDISVGVLFVDREIQDYYSEEEKDVFDLLYFHWPSGVEVFLEGKEISYSPPKAVRA